MPVRVLKATKYFLVLVTLAASVDAQAQSPRSPLSGIAHDVSTQRKGAWCCRIERSQVDVEIFQFPRPARRQPRRESTLDSAADRKASVGFGAWGKFQFMAARFTAGGIHRTRRPSTTLIYPYRRGSVKFAASQHRLCSASLASSCYASQQGMGKASCLSVCSLTSLPLGLA